MKNNILLPKGTTIKIGLDLDTGEVNTKGGLAELEFPWRERITCCIDLRGKVDINR